MPRRTSASALRSPLWPTAASLGFILFRQPAKRLFRLTHIVHGELSGFDEMGHYRLGPAAKQTQQLVDQAALCGLPGDGGFEDVGIADLLDATQSLLTFQAIN